MQVGGLVRHADDLVLAESRMRAPARCRRAFATSASTTSDRPRRCGSSRTCRGRFRRAAARSRLPRRQFLGRDQGVLVPRTPVVNIGGRQQGRLHGEHVSHVGYDGDAIGGAIARAAAHGRYRAVAHLLQARRQPDDRDVPRRAVHAEALLRSAMHLVDRTNELYSDHAILREGSA